MTQTTSAPSTKSNTGTCCTAKAVIGAFCWWENLSRNLPASRLFYAKVFGWTYTETPMECGTYVGIANNGRHFGGMMAMPAVIPAQVPSHWGPYVNVENVDATVAKVKALGGTVNCEPQDIPEVGRFACVSDPTGAAINLFTGLPGRGTQTFAADNGSFCWTELLTSDPTAAAKFYGEIFGWQATVNDIGGTAYTTFSLKGAAPHDKAACAGGMMKIKAEWGPHPSCWLSYIWVDHLEAAVQAVGANGGTVDCPPMDIPNIGRFAIVKDPAGSTFGLFSTPAASGGCGSANCCCGG
jgi:predicted enzyme related to lactoylglutathione lyase